MALHHFFLNQQTDLMNKFCNFTSASTPAVWNRGRRGRFQECTRRRTKMCSRMSANVRISMQM